MPRRLRNPFYPVLALLGVAFVLTAFAYLSATGLEPSVAVAPREGESGMRGWLLVHGERCLLWEVLALLAAAIALVLFDQRQDRAATRGDAPPAPSPDR